MNPSINLAANDSGSSNSRLTPIFILGQARSGTTLLQRLINSTEVAIVYGEHLAILTGIAESFFGFFQNPDLEKWCLLRGKPVDRTRTKEALRDSKVFCALTNGFKVDQVKDCYKSIVHDLVNAHRFDLRWGFKEVRYCTGWDHVVPFLQALFPSAQFIFTIRHPARQVESVLLSGWWDHPFEQAPAYWASQVKCMLQYCRQFPQNAILARYEDIIAEDEKAIRELFAWLRLPYSEKQTNILFQIGKVGATPRARRLPRAVEKTIAKAISETCNFPNARALYPKL